MSWLILDADAPQRDALCRLLSESGIGVSCIAADSFEQAATTVGSDPLDVALIDLRVSHALATIADLVDTHSVSAIAVSEDESRATVMAAIRAGACGFVRLADPVQGMLPALRVILDGRVWLPPTINERRSPGRPGYGTWVPAPKEPADAGLSAAQAHLLRLWAEGKSIAKIAAALATTEAEVAQAQAALQRRLDATSRLQLVLHVARMGLRLGIGQRRPP